MNKFRLFIGNFLVYGLGGVVSKIIPLLMLPVITRLMPDSTYFGISDLSNTVVSFASALAVMGMYDAMYRMFFEEDNENYKKNVCSTALIFTLVTSIIIFIVMILTKDIIAQYFFSSEKYCYVVYLSAIASLVGATNSIISAPTRMQNKRKIFLITNIVTPLISYGIAIPLLVNGYYIIALPLSSMISNILMEIAFGILNRNWFHLSKLDFKLLKQLLVIAVPLLPNFLIYWVFNSSDKIMITNLLNVKDAGIYSVGSKLGHASQLIYTAFAGGWQYFAFSTMNEDGQVKTNSLIFEYLGVVSFIMTGLICAWSFEIYKVLFTQEYLRGYIIAPYLFLAPLLQMLFQVASNQFLVIKRTWPNILILSGGAVINVILNFVLIPILGIEGAALATLVGYVVSDIVCVIVLWRIKLMVVTPRLIFSACTIAIFLIGWRLWFCTNTTVATIIVIFLMCVYLILYRDEIKNLYRMRNIR